MVSDVERSEFNSSYMTGKFVITLRRAVSNCVCVFVREGECVCVGGESV